MNKNIKLAVAGAVLALSATAANAGIIIPAGEWTIDIGGNVNSFFSQSRADGNATVRGGIAGGGNAASVNSQGTGLLPNFLSVSGSTRQNDLDVTWLISIQPGGDVGSAGQLGTQNNRQAFLTFGDKSWGSFKLGKDLGVFASDAILNDMTLLGVGTVSPVVFIQVVVLLLLMVVLVQVTSTLHGKAKLLIQHLTSMAFKRQ